MRTTERPTGVLLMAYGTPEHLDDVEAYFTDIRGGRPPSPEAVAELKERYVRIGGRSPLMAITRQQAAALERALNAEGGGFKVYAGMRHWAPRIAEVVSQMACDGVRRAVGLALTPYESKLSVGAYVEAAEQALAACEENIETTFVPSWHAQPAYLDAVAGRVTEALTAFSPDERPQVLFTAHSLPERIRAWDDPYPNQLQEASQRVAERAGVSGWRFAFQSASHTREPWLGPDVLDVLQALADGGAKAVLVCPIGFITDHLEVLYDVDVECRQAAEALGLHLERTESLNDDPQLIAALTAAVEGALA